MGERLAQARYAAFAAKADEEGLHGAASLFRACGRAEKFHEERFTALMNKKKIALPAGEIEAPEVKSTRENLTVVLQAEQAERDTFYHDAVEIAQKLGDAETAKLFDRTRTAEAEHANLLMAANWSLASMKESKAYFVCSGCGFTSEIQLPRGCPLCSGSGKMVKVE